jgi:hypothetical protein
MPTTTAPSWAARNAKFLWAAAGLVLTVATDAVDSQVHVIPGSWLPALHLVILALTAAGVQRETNAVGVEQVVQLVQHVLPGHQLVPLPAAETVFAAPAADAPYVPSAAVLAQAGVAPAAEPAPAVPTAESVAAPPIAPAA